MKKISQFFTTLMMLLLLIGCRPQQETIRYTSLSDTLIQHTTETISLPTRLTAIIKEPCKDSILQPIRQTISNGTSTATVTNEKGELKIEITTDSLKSSNSEKTQKQQSAEIITNTVTQTVTPKWIWYVLTYSVVITLWLLRKPIINLIKFV